MALGVGKMHAREWLILLRELSVWKCSKIQTLGGTVVEVGQLMPPGRRVIGRVVRKVLVLAMMAAEKGWSGAEEKRPAWRLQLSMVRIACVR